MASRNNVTTAHIATVDYAIDYVSTGSGQQHNDLVYQFSVHRLILGHPTLPSGPYSLYFRFPKSLKAGTYELVDKGAISLIYKPALSGIDGEFKSVSGSFHVTDDPTPTKLTGVFNFEGRANTAALGPAHITHGMVSVDLEAAQLNKSRGSLEVDYTILSDPTPSPRTDNSHFKSSEVSMLFAPGTDFFQVKAYSDDDNATVYIFIPVDKLETAKELDISVDEGGQNAVAFFQQGRHWYPGGRGQICYQYDPTAMRLVADFEFYEGAENSFTNGHLDIAGLDE